MQTLKFTIQGELTDFNTFDKKARTHKFQASAIKRDETNRVAWECKKTPFKPITKFPVDITFVWYCKDRRRDKDNIIFAKKFILDGLVKAGVIPDDGWNEIGDITDVVTLDKVNPRIEVYLACE